MLEALRERHAVTREPQEQVLGVGLQAFDVELFNREVFPWIVEGDRMRLRLAAGGINLIPPARFQYQAPGSHKARPRGTSPSMPVPAPSAPQPQNGTRLALGPAACAIAPSGDGAARSILADSLYESA